MKVVVVLFNSFLLYQSCADDDKEQMVVSARLEHSSRSHTCSNGAAHDIAHDLEFDVILF